MIDYARLRGWLVFHDQDSRKNPPGLPDLLLLRSGRLIFAELKSARGRLRAEQRAWLEALGHVPGIEIHVWRPADWPEIESILS